MHKPACLALIPCLLLATPPVAQDLLGPLEELVDQFTQPANPPGAEESIPAETAPVPRPRPPDRPEVPGVTPPVAETPPSPEEMPEAATTPEPDRVYQAACPAVLMGLVEAEMAPPLREGVCGEQSPLVVTAVQSRGRMVPFSSPATTNCQLASALPDWVETVDGYAQAMLGSRLASVTTGTSYMCRNRNDEDDGFTSEHGFANALDVTGFALEDGRSIGVVGQWLPSTAPEGRLLRLAHDAACGAFTTVLGPEANREHRDHLHLDLGCHGASCTARICE